LAPVVKFLIVCALYAFLRRDEIADCSGQAYDHLGVNDAMEMLMFSSDQQLLEYISEVNVLYLFSSVSIIMF
jgi:26S proteasome regulatory subunit N12